MKQGQQRKRGDGLTRLRRRLLGELRDRSRQKESRFDSRQYQIGREA